ncbi:MAG TPA: hypothetical protein VLY04_01180 [Bryobacteraceae bacterium]|nr:hypothetical protein [Bryobacteraceae bacterium]
MKIRFVLLCSVVAAALAADMPYIGRWRQNVAKSDFGQTTVTYQSLPGGEWQASFFGITYKFKMDGKDYPDGMGGTVAWKTVGANTWEVVGKTNGKATGTDTLKLSADGSTLTDSGKAVKADGGTMETTSTYQRVSGAQGLAGKWKTQKVSGAPSTVEFASSGTDGVTYKDTDMGMSCEAKLDGKDYPCTGPMMPSGFTVALKNLPPRSLDIEVKKDGKPMFKATYTVANDGKTMVETGGPTSGNETLKIVWDRM